MRAVSAIVLLSLSAFASGAEEDSNYNYGISTRGGLIMTKHAKPEYAATLRAERPDCVVVDLSYRPQSGSADDDLRTESERVAAAVSAAVDDTSDAVVVVKSVSARDDVWILYTAGGRSLAEGIDRRLSPLTRSSYRVRFDPDPEWRIFESYIQRLRE
jgi:hypothetical protein